MTNVKKVVILVIGKRVVLLVIKLMNLEKIVHLVILVFIYFLLEIKLYANIVTQILHQVIVKNVNIFQEKSNVQNAIQILFWQMENAYKVALEVAQIAFMKMENGYVINVKRISFYKR